MPADQNDIDINAVVIDRDDVSNYNPENILPEPPEIIAKLRAWLKPTSYELESGEYRKHLASHAAGTGDWLTSTSTYKNWLSDENESLLCIKGIPGSGKSVLASKIIRELIADNPGTPVLYFFFRQIIDANHEPAALLRDWLDQVLLYSPPLQKKIKEYVESKRSLSSRSMDDLWKDLRLAISGLHGKIFCIADALDEMDRGNDKFLQSLAELGKWRPHKVKVLITSRPVPTVEIPLRMARYSHIRLQETMVDVDISTYVQQGLRSSSISSEDRQLIEEAIPGRANGLFLYAKLAMDAFLEPGADAKAVLRLLPADMNAMYSDLLREHSRRSRVPDDIQLLLLQWVTHATRPLRLIEISEMLNVTHPGDVERDLKATKDLVRVACGPLLEILPDETVSVIHHSFTEYLKGSTRSQHSSDYPVLEFGETHARLGLACLKYMQAGCLDHVNPSTITESLQFHHHGEESVELKLKFPFLSYAASNWHIHLAKSTAMAHDQTAVNEALDKFIENNHRLDAWLSIRWTQGKHGTQGMAPLHVAAHCGLADWAKYLISSGGANVDVDALDNHGKTPLYIAARAGMAAVVQVLVDNGANPDQEETGEGLKPLHEAADKNHPEVIKVLLAAGVDPLTKKTRENPGNWCGNAPRSAGHTPLMYACHNGHLESVEAFLPFLKDPETVHRALAWAAEEGRAEIVARILQEPGIDVNRKIRGGTPLFRACQSGSIETVLLLLRRGANPSIICQSDQEFGGVGSYKYVSTGDSDDDDGDSDEGEGEKKTHRSPKIGYTALYVACAGPTRRATTLTGDPSALGEVLDEFIEKGADVHQQTYHGKTLLHSANSNPVWIRLLLDRGVDPDIPDDDGLVPLHDVKCIDSMAQLVEHGKADINKASTSTGKTPLFHLLDSYYSATAFKFLQYGPDCNVADHHGNGALHVALKSWSTNPGIIDALLKAGADPNLRNKAGETPLDVMDLNNGSMGRMMDLLVKAGADINARDGDGTTILFRTVKVRVSGKDDPHKDIKALLEQGARMDIRDFKGRTLLHEAIRSHPGVSDMPSSMDAVPTRLDFLISLGLDVHAVDDAGNTLLHQLSWHPSNCAFLRRDVLPVWHQLLNLGLNPDQANHRGRTPLHNLACNGERGRSFSNRNDTTDLLIGKMKSIDMADRDGITALHMAVTTSEHVTKKLLDAGADPCISTRRGLTPLHVAVRSRQSNIVGLLLDAIYIQSNPEQAHPGAWLADGRNTPVPGVDAADSVKCTPLAYACESGRPEVVSMLLKAGANVHISDLREALDSFELEQDLWNRPRPRDPENRNAGGLEPGDASRPTDGSGYQGTSLLHPFRDTTRLTEIIDMLLDHGADLSDASIVRYDTQDVNMTKTTLLCRDYTLKCLTEARHRRGLNGPKSSTATRNVTFDEHLVKYRHDACIKALRQFEGIKKGEANHELFVSRLMRRDYEVIEELFHMGVDFLAMHPNWGNTNIGLLIKGGFTSIMDRVGWLEAEKQHAKGVWHAAGDETRPGFGLNTQWAREGTAKESTSQTHARQPFLLKAVEQELPIFDMVCLLVEKFGVDIDERCPDNDLEESALHHLAKGYWWWHVGQALPYLISKGANVNLRNRNGQTPLHLAVRSGKGSSEGAYQRDAARCLIRSGADVNAADCHGKTCLSYAGSDVEMVRLLIEHGATVKVDALFSAIDGYQADVLQALLSAGAEPNMRLEEDSVVPYKLDSNGHLVHHWDRDDIPDYGWYPLHHAAAKSRFSKRAGSVDDDPTTASKMVEVLLAHGAEPLAKFTRCTSEECYHQTFDLKLQDRPKTFWNLFGPEEVEPKPQYKKPDVSFGVEKHEECVVLHQLIVDGHIVGPILTVPDINVNYPDAKKRTPLLAACASKSGPDAALHVQSEEDQTSSQAPTLSIFEHLVKLGADPEARDSDGRNALHHMLRSRHKTDEKLPHILDSLNYMTAHHPSIVNQRDKDGKTPLYLAVDRAIHEKDTTAAELLLKAGADPLVADNNGSTPLHVLVQLLWVPNLRPLFEDLVKRGCDVNARDTQGETPLFKYYRGFRSEQHKKSRHYAHHSRTKRDEPGAVSALEAAGAEFGARNNDGQGLLHVTAEGHHSRFRELLGRGLDPMIEDKNRNTALDVAAASGNLGVLKLFKRVEVEGDTESGEEYSDDLDSDYGL